MSTLLPPELPVEMHDMYRSALRNETRPKAAMVESLDDYLAHLYSLGASAVDLNKASALGQTLKELIASTPQDRLPHVEAALLCFVDDDDEEAEAFGPVELESSVAVVNAICQFFDRKDLRIPL